MIPRALSPLLSRTETFRPEHSRSGISLARPLRTRTLCAGGTALALLLGAAVSPALAEQGAEDPTPGGAPAEVAAPAPDTAIGRYYAEHQEQLGQPVSEPSSGEGWTEQLFAGGRVVDSSTAGTHLVKPGYDQVLQARGGVAALGVPENEDHLVDGVYHQDFVDPQRDSRQRPYTTDHYVMEWSSSLGSVQAFEVTGDANAYYSQLGGADGQLGAPSGQATAAAGGTVQEFQHGTLAAPADGEPHTVASGPLHEAWTERGQAQGDWGFPLREAVQHSDGSTDQLFQHARVTVGADGSVQAEDYSLPYAYEYDPFVPATEASLGEPQPGGQGLVDANGVPEYEYQEFQYGVVVLNGNGWTAVSHPVQQAYNRGDFPGLGATVGFTMDSRYGLVTRFEHGALYYDQQSQQVRAL